MMTPQPRYTLFPYTTLFRSRGVEVRHFKAWMFRFVTLEVFNRNRKAEPVGFGEIPGDLPAEESWSLVIQDRKSTRLNSSHTVISYAVFCLKKKKNTISNCKN